ncbi:MAG TPA: hypothetical protein PLN39_02865, partial [Candidatus Dojkabacteria bacterium]|nr:hypothetical protein [Candidatus Dojkabacteria bacterium]
IREISKRKPFSCLSQTREQKYSTQISIMQDDFLQISTTFNMLFFRLKTPLFNNVKYLDIFSPNLHSNVNILVSRNSDK